MLLVKRFWWWFQGVLAFLDANQGKFIEYFVQGRTDEAPKTGKRTRDQVNSGRIISWGTYVFLNVSHYHVFLHVPISLPCVSTCTYLITMCSYMYLSHYQVFLHVPISLPISLPCVPTCTYLITKCSYMYLSHYHVFLHVPISLPCVSTCTYLITIIYYYYVPTCIYLITMCS